MVLSSARPVKFFLAPPAIRQHFETTPWAKKLFEDTTLRPTITPTRSSPSDKEYTFISQTLATDSTLKAWQVWFRPPSSAYPHGEYLCLVSIGSGLNGNYNMLHGGIVALLLDENMGHAAYHHSEMGKQGATANLEVNFKRPLMTPSVVLCRSWLERGEGKKMFIRGVVEDGWGRTYAEGKTLYVEIDAEKARL